MAFKLSLMEKLTMLFSNQITECTLSINVSKRLEDVKRYIESGEFGYGPTGNVVRQTDNGVYYCYEYRYDHSTRYVVTVKHDGEKATWVELYKKTAAATPVAKSNLNHFDENVPNI